MAGPLAHAIVPMTHGAKDPLELFKDASNFQRLAAKAADYSTVHLQKARYLTNAWVKQLKTNLSTTQGPAGQMNTWLGYDGFPFES